MDPARWQKVKQVFWDALDQPTGEREQWLQERTDCDTGLRAMVLSMLGTHGIEDAEQFAPPLPERVGPYRIEGLVARRATSLVLRGERDDGTFAQKVAIKVLLLPAMDAVAQRRFAAERRVLGTLRHPNLCRILDAGELEAGPPYLVLEWIEGKPLLEYCRGLTLRRKLRMFCRLCEAIEAAHAQLVIHRDLKPEHVLVTDEGELKVLDFGIAKLLHTAEAHVDGTLPGATPLTPAYASPEQWREEPASPLMDVFSLGVIFFEMLAGRHPYGDVPAKAHEWAERITRGQALELRQAAPGMNRDLDAIAAKALAAGDRRYGSVREFRQDVEAFLAQRPVEARGGLRLYRTGRWVQRHAGRLVVGGMVVLLVGVLGWQVWEADRQRLAEALRARDRAEQLVTKVYTTLIEADLPLETRRQYVDVLATEMERIDWKGVPPEEELRTAKVLTSIAGFYGESFGANVENQERAEQFALRGIELIARRWARGPAEDATADLVGGHVLLGDIRFGAKQYEKAIEAYARVVQLVEGMPLTLQRIGLVEVGKSVALSMIGDCLLAQGRAEEVLVYQRRALVVREGYAASATGRKDPWTPVFLGNVWLSFAQCYEGLGQTGKALEAYQRSRDFLKTALKRSLNAVGVAGLLAEAKAREGVARLTGDRRELRGLYGQLQTLGRQYPAHKELGQLADQIRAQLAVKRPQSGGVQ